MSNDVVQDEKDTTFSVTFKVPEQRIKDLICCGMESGGYGSFQIVGYDPENISDHNACEYPHIDAPFLGGAVLMKDKYGDEPTVYRFDLEAVKRGLTIMGAKYPRQMTELVMEDEDAETGDVFLQCALLGEAIYG